MSGKRKPRNAGSPHARRVTLADVARVAGVSTMTASRALRGTRNVDQELVARVQQASRQLGYVPDTAARTLATCTGTHVAVLIPSLTNELFVDLLEQSQAVLHDAGYQTLFGLTHYNDAEEYLLLREQLAQRPAGLLVTGLPAHPPTQKLLADCGIPCIYMMERHPDPARYSVGFSQHQAAVALVQHLWNQGRRRIAFVAAQMDPRAVQRMQGWRHALEQYGAYDDALAYCTPQPSSISMGAEMFARIRCEQPDVDAVFFCNDDLAQGALLAALRLNVAVPQELAIVGFNDLEASAHMHPALTTVRTFRAEIGRRSAELLLQLMRGDTADAHHVDVGFEIKVRGSG